ncbi:MAG: hypothetical protein HOP12_00985 [Candidatus Eisenbacteria bacterium]|uniref:Uncharacterized protein n=1 Tax=Eiseniibacteriota bacterium TaxID=2212470 RepID=A0A849SBI3_UNCEI|nr:hypothetical protein [Candidatus Eisenbacteria bacterium]
MNATQSFARVAAALLLLASIGAARSAWAQQILLDKPIRAGELVVFPDLNDATTYYYVVDKPKLAKDASGRPQFSFLRYVENVRSGADQPEAREGTGGGIVHAVVQLSVSPEQVSNAQRELQRTRPGAKLVGPVLFKSGKVGLVSSFKDTKGNLSTQVVGLGNAPLLDGEKAAVSIQLTKLGSKVLWESFQTAAPDVTFSFEMDLGGYRSPARATIEADFDQIYQHKSFGAAVATTMLAGEIQTAFDDLRSSSAIKVTQVGTDAQMEAILSTAYNKISEMMFAPAPGTSAPTLGLLGTTAAPSLLDRASAMLAQNRARVSGENDKVRAENAAARESARKADEAARAARATAVAVAPQTAVRDTAAGTAKKPADSAGEKRARERDARAARTGDDVWGSPMALKAPLRTEESAAAERAADRAAEAAVPASPPPVLREESEMPGMAILASYEMKTVRQRGTFKLDLNKFTSDQLTLRFDENIGDLRSLTGDAAHFRQVNLDDPLFKQRELVVFVDGLNAKDFGEYVNFAAVRMRKTHQEGEASTDEVRIDRINFNKEGNNFKLLYGWKGDEDRRKWMDYEYQTTWSFFGGTEMAQPWKKASAGALALAAPFQRRSIELQADADAVARAEVRSISVKVFYKLGGAEQTRTAMLNVGKQQLSERIEFMLPGDSQDYDYEIVWQLRGNRSVSSGRKRGNSAILFVDEVVAG